jgi:hypothetical protein
MLIASLCLAGLELGGARRLPRLAAHWAPHIQPAGSACQGGASGWSQVGGQVTAQKHQGFKACQQRS